MLSSGLGQKYDRPLDRDSAYERLRAKSERAARDAADAQDFANARRYTAPTAARKSTSRSDSLTTTLAKSFVRQLGTKSGQAVVRGILGSFFKR
jgi:uncharacterized protein